MSRVKYFDVGAYPLFFGFCGSERAFNKELDRLGIDKSKAEYLTPGAAACTHVMHYLDKDDHIKDINILVAIDIEAASSWHPTKLMGVCTHEAVHVKQHIFETIEERKPGVEHEAYMVQYIAQLLFKEVLDHRVSRRKKGGLTKSRR